MASHSNSGRPPSLPPKAPLSSHNPSLADPLTRSKIPTTQRVASIGSNASAASDSSREGLRREVLRRRKSLTTSEYNFLQGIVANGTEVEVTLVQRKLNDPSLGFDPDYEYDAEDEEVENFNNNDHPFRSKENDSVDHSNSNYSQQQQQQHQAPSPAPPVADLMHLQILNPTQSLSMDNTDTGSFDVDASIDTYGTSEGKPPPRPIPLSPHRDVASFEIPSHEELYPDIRMPVYMPDTSSQRQVHMTELEIATPLVHNLRQPKSLEGAAHLPIPQIDHPLFHDDNDDHLATPSASNTTLRPCVLQRRTSNPLVDQLWRAHENGLLITPQQSSTRIQMRREQSLSSQSPLRRYSSTSKSHISRSSMSSSSHHHHAASNHNNNDVTSAAAVDPHARSLLNEEELRKIKQRHCRTQSQISTTELFSRNTQQLWRKQQGQGPHHDARSMMMVLQNTSTDSTMDTQDITSLLLPTDEEIFRRSEAAKQQDSTQKRLVTERPPPPRPFGQEPLVTKSTGATMTPPPPIPQPTPGVRRMLSDGATAGMSAGMPPRVPSALRRMTSDGSQRSKSVSWHIAAPAPAQETNKSLVTLPRAESNDLDESVSTFASEHPVQEVLREASAAHRASDTSELSANSVPWGRRDSQSSIVSLNLHKAHPIRQESIGSTAEGWEANRDFQKDLATSDWGRRDSMASVASLNLHLAHPLQQEESTVGDTAAEIDGMETCKAFLRDLAASPESTTSPISTPTSEAESKGGDRGWGRRDSTASLNLHHARHIREDSIASLTSVNDTNFMEAFQRQFAAPPGWGRRDSVGSLASLNLDLAAPIQESIFKRNDSMDSTVVGEGDSNTPRDDPFRPSGWGRRESMNSIASLNLHHARPIRQESIGSNWGRRDSMNSVASLTLHRAHPIRRDSMASTADGADALGAFRNQVVNETWGRRDSTASVASLNLHHARPIRQESIASNSEGWEAAESLQKQFLAQPDTVLKKSWGRHDSMGSMASMSSLNLHHGHPIGSEHGSTTIDVLRNVGSAFADADFESSLHNIPSGQPLMEESLMSTASGMNAREAFQQQFEDSGYFEPKIVSGQQFMIPSLMSTASGMNANEAFQQQVEDSGYFEPKILPGQPFMEESIMSTASGMNAREAFQQQFKDCENVPSIPPGQPFRQESIVSTASGMNAREAFQQQFKDSYHEALKDAQSGSALSSTSDIASLQRSSMNSIPSLHPAHPLRQDSIASSAEGKAAKELLRKQFNQASIVASQWEGVVSPDEWEDKKMEEEDVIKPRNLSRPVIMRHASASEYDEEGMEVAPAEAEPEPAMKLKTQILVPKNPGHEFQKLPDPSDVVQDQPTREESKERVVQSEGRRRQDGFQQFPNGLASIGGDSRRSIVTIEANASFDESKSIERFRGVFRGELPRSISEDDLSALLLTQCKPKPLSRGQSDATLFPADLNSNSWELDTVVGEYDAWDAIRDDYINGYGGGGTLPFRILGTSARDIDSQPHVLSPPLMESLQSFFPTAKTHDNFWMKYSMVRDGASLHTLLQHARGAKYSILALETSDGEVFGAFTAEPWRKTWNHFGTGETFLWRMRNSRKTKCYSIIDQAQMESEIDVYPYTGANQCIQLCTHNKIAVGGGSPEHPLDEEKRDDNDNRHSSINMDKEEETHDFDYGYGLALQSDLLHGTSSRCVTFGSPPLSKVHRDGSVFEIINVELWGLTPCYNEADAEKLELGRLFLEQPSFNNDTFE